jgi:hypothetical protein
VARDPVIMKWHSMDEIKASALTAGTQSPSMAFPVPVSDLPAGIQGMPGLVSAYVSHYLTTQLAAGAVSAAGEFVVARTDAGTTKAYNYVFGVSSDSKTYFAGPFKDIPGHFQTSKPVPIASLFVGHPNRGKR